MATKPDGGPAFPVGKWQGMTLRDWFAGQALAGLLSDRGPLDWSQNSIDLAVTVAWSFADVMLEAREILPVEEKANPNPEA